MSRKKNYCIPAASNKRHHHQLPKKAPPTPSRLVVPSRRHTPHAMEETSGGPSLKCVWRGDGYKKGGGWLSSAYKKRSPLPMQLALCAARSSNTEEV